MRVHKLFLMLICYVRSTSGTTAGTALARRNTSADQPNFNEETLSGETEFVKRGYGEPCTCDSDCDFGKWLLCLNGYCLCARNSFTYDYTRQTCVVKLGEKCFEIAQEYIEYNPKDLPPSIRCIEGAFCSISAGGLCACNTYGYYQSLDGTTCQRKKHYGQPCTRALECKSDVCSGGPEGRCICNVGEFYHKRRKRCVSLVGAICFSDDDCLDNGICLELGVCGCLESHQETPSKTCEMRLNYGDNCGRNQPCNNPELACIDNQCVCKYSHHQIFDNSSGVNHCLSKPGGPCVEDENCGGNTLCVQPESNSRIQGLFKECQCVPGYLEMPDGQCEKFNRQGEGCEVSSDCDPIPPLVCVDGLCDCRDALTKYDVRTRSCRGLVGARCDKKDGSDEYLCIDNAMCSQPNKQLPGRCQCQPNFSVSRDRTCVPN